MSISINLSSRVALVTGAASGIGLAAARSFCEAGASVMLADINAEVEQAAAELTRAGFEASHCLVDVSDSASCQAMVEAVVEGYGRLDYAFNNAGIGSFAQPVNEIDEADWRRMMDINLTGVFLGIKYQVPAMLENGGGVIVNNSSVLGTRALPGTSVQYTAAKHGVIGMTRQIAVNHGPDGIRCLAVCPGLVETPLVVADGEKGITQGGITEEMRAWFMERTPSKRFATPEDVAGAVVMLCADQMSYVNGTHLLIDGSLVQG